MTATLKERMLVVIGSMADYVCGELVDHMEDAGAQNLPKLFLVALGCLLADAAPSVNLQLAEGCQCCSDLGCSLVGQQGCGDGCYDCSICLGDAIRVTGSFKPSATRLP